MEGRCGCMQTRILACAVDGPSSLVAPPMSYVDIPRRLASLSLHYGTIRHVPRREHEEMVEHGRDGVKVALIPACIGVRVASSPCDRRLTGHTAFLNARLRGSRRSSRTNTDR
jgi:hypothetical protein